MNKELSLAFSPCPNDTFIFHAMINNLVDTHNLHFKVYMADVEELNKGAAEERFDICKLSYNAYCSLKDKYLMLRSGSALGFNNGPLLVESKLKHSQRGKTYSKEDNNILTHLPPDTIIAIPGEHTTAALLLKIAYPQLKNLKPMLFSEIEGAILRGDVDAGVLIHESRFTYKEAGLELITDLGMYWQNKFSLPIPLGGIAIRRSLLNNFYPDKLILPKHELDSNSNTNELEYLISSIIKQSIEYALQNPQASEQFIACNAQELSPLVQKKHIELFVNDYSLDIGELGEKAVGVLASAYLLQNKIFTKKHIA